MPMSDEALREYCDKNYHQILPIIAEKVHQEKVQHEKLKAVKARLNFEEASHQGKEVRNEKQCSKGWRRVYSTGSETRRRVCPHTRDIQGVGHTTVAAETLKAATRVLALEEQNFLLRNIITKEHPREKRKGCQKVKVAQEDIRIQNQRGKSQVLRTTCPNHGYMKKQILSLLESVTLTFQKLECLVTLRRMTEVKTQNIT
ncbi:hypothetical protein Tco_0359945 [Tanacetum coccineum]